MLTRTQTILQQDGGLANQKLVIVGVSGGTDSLTLLDILFRLGYPLVVAHFNHQLRPEAGDEARIVEGIAAKMEIPFALGEGSTPDYAQEHHLSLEEAARELRYHFLFEQAVIYHAQAVAVAHNADDQVETALMHLLRGAGLDGLTGMTPRSLPNPWSDAIPLVRPLLSIWRTEIESYCAERGLISILDATNAETTFFRNHLRHDLIPELETYVPGFRSRLWQTADLLAAERSVLDELTEKAWAEVATQTGAGFAAFHLPAFRLQPLALQRRLVRKAVSLLRPGARDLDFSMVQHVISFTAQPTSTRQSDIGLDLCVFLEDDELLIAAWEADLPTTQWPQIKDQMSLPLPGELDLGSGWMLKAEIPWDVESAKIEARENRDPFQAWGDLRNQQSFLSLRMRLPGDRFQPLGMEGKSLKISDFMINQKIPRRARTGWPLVCVGDEIVWVPGYRQGQTFRVTDQTQTIVKLTLQPG